MPDPKMKKVEETPIEVFKSNGTVVKELNTGTIVFYNSNLVTAKMIEILCLGIEKGGFEHDGLGLFSVIFRNDGYPLPADGEKVEWMYFPDSYSAVCNIKHLMDICVSNTQNESKEIWINIGIRCAIWRALLTGFFHECSHAMRGLSFEGGLPADDEIAHEEAIADEVARNIVTGLAKEFDIEMSFTPEMDVLIADRINEELSLASEIADGDGDDFLQKWIDIQTYIKDNGGVFYQPEEDVEDFFFASFKEFLHLSSGDDADDPEWLKETLAVPSTTTVNAIEIEVIDVPNPQFIGSVDEVPDFSTELEDDIQLVTDTPVVAGMEGVSQVVQPNTTTIMSQPIAPVNANANQQVVVGANMYQASTLDVGSFQATIKGLYLKVFAHIYQNCGFMPANNPAFTQGTKIADMIPLTQTESAIVKEMVCYNELGTKCPGTKVESHISGIFIDKGNTLPGYDLTIADMNGAATTRRFIPQNPHKTKPDGSLSMTAQMAREGHQIMWIINPDSTDKQFALRIHNGVLQSNNAGQWAAI